jgi:hypothetical protein
VPSLTEILTALYGAWRIALRDPQAAKYFDLTPDGFWRSFAAVFLTLPASLYFHYHNGAELGVIELVRQVMIYGVAWLAYPAVIHRILLTLDRGDRFIDYIVPYNWASLPIAYLIFVVALVSGADITSGTAAAMMAMIIYIGAFVYLWQLARTTLDIGHGAAFGIVAFDLVFSLLIVRILESVWVMH